MSNGSKRWIINMGRKLYFLLLTVFIFSCNGQKKMAQQNDANVNATLTLLDQNNYSGADSTETMVITNAKALKSFYSRINRTRKPGLPVPEIDFSKNMVVILCSSDEVADNEYGLSVLEETDTEMVFGRAKMAKNEDSTSSLNPTTLVSPFFVYKMPLTEKKVTFRKSE